MENTGMILSASAARKMAEERVLKDAAEAVLSAYEELASLVSDCISAVSNSVESSLQHGLEQHITFSGGVFSNEAQSNEEYQALGMLLTELADKGYTLERNVIDGKDGLKVSW